MFINQFLIKNLGAKEHFFFEINKYFGEKKCIIVHKHPLIVHIFGIFFLFCWSFQIILLLLYGIN